MGNRFLLMVVAIIAIFGGLLFINKKDTSKGGGSDKTATLTQHTQGEGTEGVTLVEYGDFECPACGAFYPVLKEVKQKYGDKITFQFRHFPLAQSHPNAMAAHRAAEAAHKQGKFWEMHDLLYENQASWTYRVTDKPAPIFEQYAQQLNLVLTRFKADVASGTTNSIINADIAEGSKLRVTGTPTFFLNGKRLNNDDLRSPEAFSKIIDEAIKDKSSD